ncbi:MAG: hypothetical protein J2P54_08510 [Bradyrhizobiaceae bacterium]|nr:hypothetical protein [Bradyrhizobiaceae bacterium]
MKKLISLLAGALLFATQASATVVITRDSGGLIEAFVQKYEGIRASGDQVIVAGRCLSSCTMMLGIVRDSQICATPRGVFGFHSGMEWFPGRPMRYSPYWTQVMWRGYPERVRNLLRSRGWSGGPHPGLIMIRATDIVRPCQGGAPHAGAARRA